MVIDLLPCARLIAVGLNAQAINPSFYYTCRDQKWVNGRDFALFIRHAKKRLLA